MPKMFESYRCSLSNVGARSSSEVLLCWESFVQRLRCRCTTRLRSASLLDLLRVLGMQTLFTIREAMSASAGVCERHL